MTEVYADIWSFLGDHDCHALCITTNGTIKRDGRGVMGRGVARDALRRFPGIDRFLGEGIAKNGNVVQSLLMSPGPMLVAFPVKYHWVEPADLDLIACSAAQLVVLADVEKWRKVVLPRPGCGNGQRTWEVVRPAIERFLDDRFVVVEREMRR
jgi:hypothetical protein